MITIDDNDIQVYTEYVPDALQGKYWLFQSCLLFSNTIQCPSTNAVISDNVFMLPEGD